MKESRKLFTLIKTMNKGEKRAFKLYSRKYNEGDNAYSRLFDIINKESGYDEDRIRKKFIGLKENPKRFPVVKSRLFNQILSGLRNYKEDRYEPYRIDMWIGFADELISRGMYKASLDYLAKGESLAKETQNYRQLLRIYEMQASTFRRVYGFDALGSMLDGLKMNREYAEQCMARESHYSDLYREIYHHYRTEGIARSPEGIEKYQSFKKRFDDYPEDSDTVKSRNFRHLARTIFLYGTGEYEEAAATVEEQVAYLEQHSFFIKENIDEYLKAINNTVTVLASKDRYDDALTYLEKLKELEDDLDNPNLFVEQRIFEIYHASKLNMAVETGDIQGGLALEIPVMDGLERYSGMGLSLDRNVRFCLGFAILRLWNGNPNQALDWLLRIEKMEGDAPANIMAQVKSLSLMIHYDLENFTLLDSLVRGNTRYLKKYGLFRETEQLLNKTMSKLVKTPMDSRASVFSKMDQELGKLLLLPQHSNEYLNSSLRLPTWVKAKVSGKHVKDLIS